ncbi:hypothetical protein BDY24DRAFT_393476 [Mrakia frigida]|uniref:uncharacterized protein n=1 Tax=Mrakia frigida TaxID=29902 RepID=UPI003FCC19A0
MFQTRPLPVSLPIDIPFSSSSSHPHSPSQGSIEVIPSEDELVMALSEERNKNPEMGMGKLVENVRFVKGWSVGEKRVKKILKSHPDLSVRAAQADIPSPPPSPQQSLLNPVNLASLTSRSTKQTPTGTRGRVRTPKPIASSSMCAQTSICNHKAHMDAWLPGPLKKVRIHLDYLHSLAPPDGRTFFHNIKLHILTCSSTGREYVLAPEVCRAIWSRLDASAAHLAHSMYSPAPTSFPSEQPEIRLLGCPQGLKTNHCTTLGRRGDLEKCWIFQAGPDGEDKEIRIELGAECHSDNPAKPKPKSATALTSSEAKGKGVVRLREAFVKVKASDLVQA